MKNKGVFESLTHDEQVAVLIAIVQKLRQMRKSQEYDITNDLVDYWRGPIGHLENAESKLRRV